MDHVATKALSHSIALERDYIALSHSVALENNAERHVAKQCNFLSDLLI